MIPMIVNPSAGGGRCGAKVTEAVAALRQGGVEVTVHETAAAGDATAIARSLWAEGHRTILVAGGDGTAYEVVNGLFPQVGDDRPTLGFIPLGTGNSFLRDFGILSADDAIAAVIRGRTRASDVVKATHTGGALHYINLLSIGFTSEVASLANRRFKLLGQAGYTLATLVEVVRLASTVFPVRLDDGELDTRPAVFLSFSNSRYTGGTMMMAPHADPADGQLDVIRVGDLTRAELLGQFPKLYQGKHLAHAKNEASVASHVDLQLDGPVDVMVDGEVVRLQLTALDVLPQALDVLA